MPVPFKIGGGGGIYQGAPVFYPSVPNDFENVLNEGRLKSAPMDYKQFKPFTKEAAGQAFQGLLNTFTNNPVAFTPGYNPMIGGTGYNPEVQQVMNAFTGRGLTLKDDTGVVSLTPGGLTVQSNKGWGATVNPISAGVNVGPFGLEGGWQGDKYIKGSINLGNKDRLGGMNMGQMGPIVIEGLDDPNKMFVRELSDVQKLKEQTINDYQKNNPYWYRP